MVAIKQLDQATTKLVRELKNYDSYKEAVGFIVDALSHALDLYAKGDLTKEQMLNAYVNMHFASIMAWPEDYQVVLNLGRDL